jgi:hypothetical protein
VRVNDLDSLLVMEQKWDKIYTRIVNLDAVIRSVW